MLIWTNEIIDIETYRIYFLDFSVHYDIVISDQSWYCNIIIFVQNFICIISFSAQRWLGINAQIIAYF